MKSLTVIVIACMLSGCYGKQPDHTGLIGKPMLATEVLTLDSAVWNTTNIPKGQPTVYFYFTPDCPYCQGLTKELVKDSKKDTSLQYFLFSHAPLERLREFSALFKINETGNIHLLQDAGNIMNYYGVKVVPHLVLFDEKGAVIKVIEGKTDLEKLKASIISK